MKKAYNVEILSVGTEILLGHTTNTDARDISLMLSELGINVKYHTVVGDNPQRLADCTDNVAVFYDPTADDYRDFTGSNEESYVESSKEQSLEELRAQVRDFLQWLKAQGVI